MQPKNLLEITSQYFLENVDHVPFWLALTPKKGLLYIFSSEKFSDPKPCHLLISKIVISEDSVNEIASQNIIPPSSDQIPIWSLECLSCFRREICWPLAERFIQKNWIYLVYSFKQNIIKKNLLLPTMAYTLALRKPWSFYFLYSKIVDRLQRNTFSKIFSQILLSNIEDKLDLLEKLIKVGEKLKENYKDMEMDLVKACTVKGVKFSDFQSVMLLNPGTKNVSLCSNRILLHSFVQGNTEIFLYVASKYPETLDIFDKPDHIPFLLGTSPEIAEFLSLNLPKTIRMLHCWLASLEKSDFISVQNILKMDITNLYRVEPIAEYFSKTKVLHLFYDVWYRNLENQIAKKGRNFYLSSFFAIVRCLDEYDMSLQDVGNRFCDIFLKQESTVGDMDFWYQDLCHVAEKVIFILVKYGFTFTGKLPHINDLFTPSNLLNTLQILYFTSSNDLTTSTHFLHKTIMADEPRSLVNLAAVVIRKHKNRSMKGFLQTLGLPKEINRQITMREQLKKFNTENERKAIRDVMTGIFMGKTHQNCSDLKRENNYLLQNLLRSPKWEGAEDNSSDIFQEYDDILDDLE